MMMHTDAGCWLLAGGVVAMGVLIAAALGEVVWGRLCELFPFWKHFKT